MIVDVMIFHRDGSYEIVQREVPDDYYDTKVEDNEQPSEVPSEL